MGRKRPKNPVRRERKHQRYSDGIMELYDGKCDLCGKKGSDTIDHVVPVAWGGADHPSNLVPAHRSCNSSKGADRPDRKEWREPSKWLPGYGANVSGLVHVPMLPWIGPVVLIPLLVLGFALRWLGMDMRVPFVETVGAALIVVPLVVDAAVVAVWLVVCWWMTRQVRGKVTIQGDEWLKYELSRKLHRSKRS